MDEKILIQFLQKASGMRLSPAAKKAGRERLLVLMRRRPLALRRPTGNWRVVFRLHRLAFSGMAAALLVFIAGGGASLAAERSLPGEGLYAFKTNVNERLLEKLAFSAQAKAEWEQRLVERRVEEADQLILEGKLDRIILEEEEEDEKGEALEEAHRLRGETEEEERLGKIREAFEEALSGDKDVRLEVLGNRVFIQEKKKERKGEKERKDEKKKGNRSESSQERDRGNDSKDSEEQDDDRESVQDSDSEDKAG